MNEKQLLEALSPYIDELVKVVKRMDELERQPGPPGKDASLDDMLELLKSDPAFRGDPGKDADMPPIEEIAKYLVERYAEVLKGDPGKDGDPGAGEPGDPGKDADPDLIVAKLLENATFLEKTKGEPGKDGNPGEAAAPIDPAEIVAILKGDTAFLEAIKGQPGESIKGDPGETIKGDPGRDGLDGVGLLAPTHEVNKVYREGSLVTAFIGQFFRAKVDTAAAPGDSDDWERVGTAGFRWRGLKPDEKSLKLGDIFVDNGSLFGFLGTKASMMVQRPKPAPHVTKVTVKGGDLILGLSTGDELTTPLPYDPNATKTIDSLSKKVMELDKALRSAEDTIKDLVDAVKTLDERSAE